MHRKFSKRSEISKTSRRSRSGRPIKLPLNRSDFSSQSCKSAEKKSSSHQISQKFSQTLYPVGDMSNKKSKVSKSCIKAQDHVSQQRQSGQNIGKKSAQIIGIPRRNEAPSHSQKSLAKKKYKISQKNQERWKLAQQKYEKDLAERQSRTTINFNVKIVDDVQLETIQIQITKFPLLNTVLQKDELIDHDEKISIRGSIKNSQTVDFEKIVAPRKMDSIFNVPKYQSQKIEKANELKAIETNSFVGLGTNYKNSMQKEFTQATNKSKKKNEILLCEETVPVNLSQSAALFRYNQKQNEEGRRSDSSQKSSCKNKAQISEEKEKVECVVKQASQKAVSVKKVQVIQSQNSVKTKKEKNKDNLIAENRRENFQNIYKTNEIVQTCQPYVLTIPKRLLNMREIYKTPTRTKLPLKIVVEKSVISTHREKSKQQVNLPKIHSPLKQRQVGKSSLLKKSNTLQDSLKKLKKTDKDFTSEKKKTMRKFVGQKEPVKNREQIMKKTNVEKSQSYSRKNKDSNQYDLKQCKSYKGDNQNPQVYISFSAMLMMQVHSHLLKNEVIGFMAGYTINQSKLDKKTLVITEVYPAETLKPKGSQAYSNLSQERNVEICPESASNIKKKVDKRGQEILGWYHSHPYFEAQPSKIDISNHETYQNFFTKDNKLFIGAITSPYYREKCENTFKNLCMTRCFQLEKKIPYDLRFRLLPESKIKKRIMDKLYDMTTEYMETFKTEEKINFKEKCKGRNGLKHGQKFMNAIQSLCKQNSSLLTSDNDTNDECPEFLHFGKDFKYSLKSDGSIVTQHMDSVNEVEQSCKKVMVDKATIGDEIVDKISNIIQNAHDTLTSSDFVISKIELSDQKSGVKTRKSQQTTEKKIDQDEDMLNLQSQTQKTIAKEDELGKLAEQKEFDAGQIECHDDEDYELLDLKRKTENKQADEQLLFGNSQENNQNIIQKQLFKDKYMYEQEESDSNMVNPKNLSKNIDFDGGAVMNSEEKDENKNGFSGVSTNFNANSNITNCSSNLQQILGVDKMKQCSSPKNMVTAKTRLKSPNQKSLKMPARMTNKSKQNAKEQHYSSDEAELFSNV